MMPKRVLFVISIYNYHREVEPVVAKFVKEGWRVDVVLGWRGNSAQDAVKGYEAMGAHVFLAPADICYGVDEPDPAKQSSNQEVPISPLIEKGDQPVSQRIKSLILRVGLFKFILDVRYQYRRISKIKQYVCQTLDLSVYDAAFQGPFHSVGQIDNVFYKMLKQANVPNFCYPVSAYHGRRNAIMARKNNIDRGMVSKSLFVNDNVLNRLVAVLFPDWHVSYEGRTFFLSETSLMIASTLSNVQLEDIWSKPQPGFERIFVYSEFSRSLLEDGVFPMEKAVVCGIPLLDGAVERLEHPDEITAIYDHVDLINGTPFLLFNVEPSFEHHYCDEKTHWQRFDRLMQIVSSRGVPVVLSLHPLCEYENYKYAIDKYGIKISTKYKIHDLYPLCGAVVSFACSTNILAEIFKKQLIIYDFFDMTSPESPRAIEFRLPFADFCYSTDEVSQKLSDLTLSDDRLDDKHMIEKSVDVIYDIVSHQ